MKKSPFTLLREAIENELFNASLSLQKNELNGEKVNPDFYLGYTEAMKFMLQKANFIYRFGKPPKF